MLEKEKPRIIWQYWEQGWDNAPEIVKKCVTSVEKHKNNCEQILLDMNNLKDYVEIPQYIYDLKEKGIIKSAHFSDIVRTYLLCKHGGTWVDATVLFTEDLPEYIINSDLFVFQNELRIDFDGLNMASYFMSAKPNNLIMQCCKSLFEIYWKENLFLLYLHVEHIEEFNGIRARVFQHEYDHLQGKVFVDRLSTLRKTLLKRKLNDIAANKVRTSYRMKPNPKK